MLVWQKNTELFEFEFAALVFYKVVRCVGMHLELLVGMLRSGNLCIKDADRKRRK